MAFSLLEAREDGDYQSLLNGDYEPNGSEAEELDGFWLRQTSADILIVQFINCTQLHPLFWHDLLNNSHDRQQLSRPLIGLRTQRKSFSVPSTGKATETSK
jgi:hypothetical protein